MTRRTGHSESECGRQAKCVFETREDFGRQRTQVEALGTEGQQRGAFSWPVRVTLQSSRYTPCALCSRGTGTRSFGARKHRERSEPGPAALNTWMKQRKLCQPGSRAEVTRLRVSCSTLEFLRKLTRTGVLPATRTRLCTALSRSKRSARS